MINEELLKSIIENMIVKKDKYNYFDFKHDVADAYHASTGIARRKILRQIDSTLGDYSVTGELFNELLSVNDDYYIVYTRACGDDKIILILKLDATTEEAARFAFATFGL